MSSYRCARPVCPWSASAIISQSGPPEKLITLFHEQEHNLEEQITKLERIKSMVRSRLQHTKQGILIGSEKIWIEDYPEENLFLGPDLPENFQLSDGWDWLPSFYKSCIEYGIQIGFTVGLLVEFDATKAMLSSKPIKYFCRLPQDQYPDYYIKPAGHYIVGTQYTDYEHTDALYRKMFQYMDGHGLKINGNAYEEYLIDEIAEKNAERYMLQISIQIE